MEEIQIKAEARKFKGKSAVKNIRRNGGIPAVLYGKDTESIPITIALKEWEIVKKNLKRNAILKMELNNNNKIEVKPVMIKNIQRGFLKQDIIHIDFLQVSMKRKIEVEIPIQLIGEAKGVINNGIIELHLRTIMMECLPSQIPEKVEIDISKLDIGDSIHVKEISLPGVRLLENPDVAVVTIIPPTSEEKAVTEEPVEPEEKEEKEKEKEKEKKE